MHGDPLQHGDRRQRDRAGSRPASGWRDVTRRVRVRVREDDLTIISAGVAFYALLSVVPALTALVAAYGIVSEPDDVAAQIQELKAPIPDEARRLLSTQLSELASTGSGSLGVGLVVGLAASLWGASAAVNHLLVAVATVYGEREGRGFVRRRSIALAMTVAGIGFVAVVMLILTGLPGWAGDVAGPVGRVVASALRWPVLAALMLTALAVIYRVGSDRRRGWQWVSWGAVVAVVVWVAASAGFSLYVSTFGTYNQTYGALGGVIVFMLWLLISVSCVLLGAEVNAVLEGRHDREIGGRPAGSRVGAIPRPMP